MTRGDGWKMMEFCVGRGQCSRYIFLILLVSVIPFFYISIHPEPHPIPISIPVSKELNSPPNNQYLDSTFSTFGGNQPDRLNHSKAKAKTKEAEPTFYPLEEVSEEEHNHYHDYYHHETETDAGRKRFKRSENGNPSNDGTRIRNLGITQPPKNPQNRKNTESKELTLDRKTFENQHVRPATMTPTSQVKADQLVENLRAIVKKMDTREFQTVMFLQDKNTFLKDLQERIQTASKPYLEQTKSLDNMFKPIAEYNGALEDLNKNPPDFNKASQYLGKDFVQQDAKALIEAKNGLKKKLQSIDFTFPVEISLSLKEGDGLVRVDKMGEDRGWGVIDLTDKINIKELLGQLYFKIEEEDLQTGHVKQLDFDHVERIKWQMHLHKDPPQRFKSYDYLSKPAFHDFDKLKVELTHLRLEKEQLAAKSKKSQNQAAEVQKILDTHYHKEHMAAELKGKTRSDMKHFREMVEENLKLLNPEALELQKQILNKDHQLLDLQKSALIRQNQELYLAKNPGDQALFDQLTRDEQVLFQGEDTKNIKATIDQELKRLSTEWTLLQTNEAYLEALTFEKIYEADLWALQENLKNLEAEIAKVSTNVEEKVQKEYEAAQKAQTDFVAGLHQNVSDLDLQQRHKNMMSALKKKFDVRNDMDQEKGTAIDDLDEYLEDRTKGILLGTCGRLRRQKRDATCSFLAVRGKTSAKTINVQVGEQKLERRISKLNTAKMLVEQSLTSKKKRRGKALLPTDGAGAGAGGEAVDGTTALGKSERKAGTTAGAKAPTFDSTSNSASLPTSGFMSKSKFLWKRFKKTNFVQKFLGLDEVKRAYMGSKTVQKSLAPTKKTPSWKGGVNKLAAAVDVGNYAFLIRDFTKAALTGDATSMAIMGTMTGVQVASTVLGKIALGKKVLGMSIKVGEATAKGMMVASRLGSTALTFVGAAFDVMSIVNSGKCLAEKSENAALCRRGDSNCKTENEICDGRDNVFDIVSSSLSLVGTAISLAFPPAAPFVAIFSFFMMLFGQVYQTNLWLDNFEKDIPLYPDEREREFGRRFIGMDMTEYLVKLQKQKQQNTELLIAMHKFLEKDQDKFWAYFAPGLTEDGVAILNNTVKLRMIDYGHKTFERWSPDPNRKVEGGKKNRFDDFNFFCRPRGDSPNKNMFRGYSYLCENSMGLRIDPKGGKSAKQLFALFSLEGGSDMVFGFEYVPNYFDVQSGFKDFSGGNADDMFVIQNEFEGVLNGGGGQDTLVLSENLNSSTVTITNTWEVPPGNNNNPGAVQLLQISTSADQSRAKSAILKDINIIQGRENEREVIHASCSISTIDGAGGSDEIYIDKELSCPPSSPMHLRVVVRPEVTVKNCYQGPTGTFFYELLNPVPAPAPLTTKRKREAPVGRVRRVGRASNSTYSSLSPNLDEDENQHQIPIPFPITIDINGSSPSVQSYLSLNEISAAEVQNLPVKHNSSSWKFYIEHLVPINFVTSSDKEMENLQILTKDRALLLAVPSNSNSQSKSAANSDSDSDSESENKEKMYTFLFDLIPGYQGDTVVQGSRRYSNYFKLLSGTYEKIVGGDSGNHFVLGEDFQCAEIVAGSGGVNTIEIVKGQGQNKDQGQSQVQGQNKGQGHQRSTSTDFPHFDLDFQKKLIKFPSGSTCKLEGSSIHHVKGGLTHIEKVTVSPSILSVDLKGAISPALPDRIIIPKTPETNTATDADADSDETPPQYNLTIALRNNTRVSVFYEGQQGSITYRFGKASGQAEVFFGNLSKTCKHTFALDFYAQDLQVFMTQDEMGETAVIIQQLSQSVTGLERNQSTLKLSLNSEEFQSLNSLQIFTKEKSQILFLNPTNENGGGVAFKFSLTQSETNSSNLNLESRGTITHGAKLHPNFFIVNGIYKAVHGGDRRDKFIIGPEAQAQLLDGGGAKNQNQNQQSDDGDSLDFDETVSGLVEIDFSRGVFSRARKNVKVHTQLVGNFRHVQGRSSGPEILITNPTIRTINLKGTPTQHLNNSKSNSNSNQKSRETDLILIPGTRDKDKDNDKDYNLLIDYHNSSQLLVFNGARDGKFVYHIKGSSGKYHVFNVYDPYQNFEDFERDEDLDVDKNHSKSQENSTRAFTAKASFHLSSISFFDLYSLETESTSQSNLVKFQIHSEDANVDQLSFKTRHFPSYDTLLKEFEWRVKCQHPTSNRTKNCPLSTDDIDIEISKESTNFSPGSDPEEDEDALMPLNPLIKFPTFTTWDDYEIVINHLGGIHAVTSIPFQIPVTGNSESEESSTQLDSTSFQVEEIAAQVINQHIGIVNDLGISLIISLVLVDHHSDSNSNSERKEIHHEGVKGMIFMGGDDGPNGAGFSKPKIFIPEIVQEGDSDLRILVKYLQDPYDPESGEEHQEVVFVGGVEDYQKLTVRLYVATYHIQKDNDNDDEEISSPSKWSLVPDSLVLSRHPRPSRSPPSQMSGETRPKLDLHFEDGLPKRIEHVFLSHLDLFEYLDFDIPIQLDSSTKALDPPKSFYRAGNDLVITNQVDRNPPLTFHDLWTYTDSFEDDYPSPSAITIFLLDMQRSMEQENFTITIQNSDVDSDSDLRRRDEDPQSPSPPPPPPFVFSFDTFHQLEDYEEAVEEMESKKEWNHQLALGILALPIIIIVLLILFLLWKFKFKFLQWISSCFNIIRDKDMNWLCLCHGCRGCHGCHGHGVRGKKKLDDDPSIENCSLPSPTKEPEPETAFERETEVKAESQGSSTKSSLTLTPFQQQQPEFTGQVLRCERYWLDSHRWTHWQQLKQRGDCFCPYVSFIPNWNWNLSWRIQGNPNPNPNPHEP